MKPELYEYYQAEVRIKNKETLKPDSECVDGMIINVHAAWIIEKGKYEGQFAMVPREGYWLPEEDLILIKVIPFTEYFKKEKV